MRKMASIVWKYFSVSDKDKTTCICNLCKVVIARGGKSAKTFTTSNMMNHLQKKPPEESGKEKLVKSEPIPKVLVQLVQAVVN